MYIINESNPGLSMYPTNFRHSPTPTTHPQPSTPPLYMPPVYVPSVPLPGTVGMFPGIQYMIPYELIKMYGPSQGTTMQLYGQPMPLGLQSLPKPDQLPPYYSTPPHVMPAPQPGISWLETIGQYLPPVEQLFGRFYY